MFRLIAVLMITIPLFAAAPVRDVNVLTLPGVEITNAPNVNVISMPNVSVTNTPDVNVIALPGVDVLTLPGIEVINVPDVRVVNTIPIPVTFDASASFPRFGFAGHALSHFDDGLNLVAVGSFVTPLDSTLVLEMVSTKVSIRNSSSRLERIRLTVQDPTTGTLSNIYLPVSDTNRSLVGSQLDFIEYHLHNVKVYIKPGSVLSYTLQTSLPNAGGNAIMHFNGYLVPVGAPSLAP